MVKNINRGGEKVINKMNKRKVIYNLDSGGELQKYEVVKTFSYYKNQRDYILYVNSNTLSDKEIYISECQQTESGMMYKKVDDMDLLKEIYEYSQIEFSE